MHGHEQLEAAAAISLVVLGALFLAASWRARAQASSTTLPNLSAQINKADAGRVSSSILAIAVAAFLAGAGIIHLAVTDEHAHLDPLLGQAFAFTAVLQGALAFFVALRVKWARPAVVVTQLAIIAVWAISRIYGLPFGSQPWRSEAVGIADIVATSFEIGAVLLLVAAFDAQMNLRERIRSIGDDVVTAAVPAIGIACVATLVALAAVSGEAGHLHP